jgi:hypothetical protein
MINRSPNLEDELRILQEKLNYDLAFPNDFLFANAGNPSTVVLKNF